MNPSPMLGSIIWSNLEKSYSSSIFSTNRLCNLRVGVELVQFTCYINLQLDCVAIHSCFFSSYFSTTSLGAMLGAPIQLPGILAQSISFIISFTLRCSDTSDISILCPAISVDTSSCLPTAPHMTRPKSHPCLIAAQYFFQPL